MAISTTLREHTRLSVLGELSITIDGAEHELPRGNRVRSVWAALAINPGHVTTTDSLIETVWGAAVPRRARESVHVHISQLRLFLSQIGLPAGVIETRGGGYRLEMRRESLDWCRALDNVAEAVHLRRGGHTREALALADSVVEGFRFPILGGVSAGVRIGAFVRQMEELHLRAHELRNDTLIEIGENQRAIHELQALVSMHPVRESLHCQLMRAFYNADRQIEALDVYSRLRDTLSEEFGVEPGRLARQYHSAILAADAIRLEAQLEI
jgi:DNA-binding SARP family transcriptional activator